MIAGLILMSRRTNTRLGTVIIIHAGYANEIIMVAPCTSH